MEGQKIRNEPDAELVATDLLTPHPENPREGDIEAIRSSILAHGFVGTLVVQKTTNYILAGNHRYKAAKSLGYQSLPVVWIDCDPEEAKRILLADNRTSDRATYDDEALQQLLTSLTDGPDSLDGTGWEDCELGEMLLEHDAQKNRANQPNQQNSQASRELDKSPSMEDEGSKPEAPGDNPSGPLEQKILIRIDPDYYESVSSQIKQLVDGRDYVTVEENYG
jgi:hypothetical protein